MRKPDFFIVGAPKCGTTALTQYLAEHPRIYTASAKDSNYFSHDLPGLRSIRTEPDYEKLFCGACAEHRAIGEASAMYLYSHDAAPAIRAYAPEAKLIVLLRNPSDLVLSFHAQLVYSHQEDEANPERAWDLQAERAAGNHLPPASREPKQLQYAAVARLGEQLERLLTVFPRDQVAWFFLDDLAADPAGVYEGALNFLNVDSDGRSAFPRFNVRKQQRISVLGRITENPPEWFRRTVRSAKRVLRIDEFGLFARLRRWNDRTLDKAPPISEVFRQRLTDTFTSDIALLQRITGRDLRPWLEGDTLQPEIESRVD